MTRPGVPAPPAGKQVLAEAARAVAVILAIGAVLAGCGTTPEHTSLPPVVAAPSTLAADGSVPYVDEPAGPHEYDLPVPVDPSPGRARSCKASQLTGEMAEWTRKGSSGEMEGVRQGAPGLFGYIRVSLRTGKPCTLQGLVSGQLLIDGQPAPVRYSNGVVQQAQDRVILVTADRAADLRIDWSPPYCGPTGAQAFTITLPHDGGTLDAPVLHSVAPVCSGESETSANLRTYVSFDVFTPHAEPTSLDSPLEVLRATLADIPSTARAGDTLHFRVRLTNPTDKAVSLTPCPGYYQERFILGTEGRTGFNTSQPYRLNCRPVRSLAAHAFIDFQMQAKVPDDPPGGPTFSVTWRLIAPHLAGRQNLTCGFSVTLM